LGDYVKYLEHMVDDLKILQLDIQKIIDNKKNDKDKKDFKDINLKSMRQITTLYKSKGDIDAAKSNPDTAFITNKLDEIFGK